MPILPILTILVAVAVVLALLLLRNRARRDREMSWEQIVSKLCPVESEGVATISNRYLNPQKNLTETQPQAMYQMLGGMAGLNAMYENSKVILALAGYATRWNFEEGYIVTEKIRRDAVRLQRTIMLIQLEIVLKDGIFYKIFRLRKAAFRLEEAASLYQRMTLHLLALYESSHVGLYPQLLAAL